MLEDLTDEQINQLITDHWREIKGLIKEKHRRNVSNANQIRSGDDFLDRETA